MTHLTRWTIIENHHEPIIDKELFEKVIEGDPLRIQKVSYEEKEENNKFIDELYEYVLTGKTISYEDNIDELFDNWAQEYNKTAEKPNKNENKKPDKNDEEQKPDDNDNEETVTTSAQKTNKKASNENEKFTGLKAERAACWPVTFYFRK